MGGVPVSLTMNLDPKPGECTVCHSQKFETLPRGDHIGEYCATCGKWQRWIPKPIDREGAMSFIMPFGKYKGRELSSILAENKGYVEWLSREFKGKPLGDKAAAILDGPVEGGKPPGIDEDTEGGYIPF